MPGRISPNVKVALRCGYASPRRKSSLLALRSTSACKTGRNLPFSVNDAECLDLATPDVPSDQRNVKGFLRPPMFRRRPTSRYGTDLPHKVKPQLHPPRKASPVESNLPTPSRLIDVPPGINGWFSTGIGSYW